jgi:hypothetical protein
MDARTPSSPDFSFLEPERGFGLVCSSLGLNNFDELKGLKLRYRFGLGDTCRES